MIDDFIDDLGRRLVMPARKRRRIVEDVREHLDDAIAELRTQGVDQSTAERRAIAAFGRVPTLASECNAQVAGVIFRRTPLTMALSGLAVVAGFLLAALPQPRQSVSASADIVQQVAFFTAILGLQFAFVAGMRVLIRVGARWRDAPSAADHQLTRSAEMVFVAGLAVAAGGWTIALADAFADTGEAGWPTLVAGEILMIVPSIVACVVTTRRRWPPISDSPAPTTASRHSVFALAEQGIASAGRQPLLWCGGVAVLAALSAMSHAETTVRGALVWGAVQAGAVVGGFVVLGRMLEFRGRHPVDTAAG